MHVFNTSGHKPRPHRERKCLPTIYQVFVWLVGGHQLEFFAIQTLLCAGLASYAEAST